MSDYEEDDRQTGLPGLRSWPVVYAVVVGAFCLWVLGLLALAAYYP